MHNQHKDRAVRPASSKSVRQILQPNRHWPEHAPMHTQRGQHPMPAARQVLEQPCTSCAMYLVLTCATAQGPLWKCMWARRPDAVRIFAQRRRENDPEGLGAGRGVDVQYNIKKLVRAGRSKHDAWQLPKWSLLVVQKLRRVGGRGKSDRFSFGHDQTRIRRLDDQICNHNKMSLGLGCPAGRRF